MAMEVVELKVGLHCKRCEKSVRQALTQITGVKCVETDLESNKIRVLGYMNRKVVVKAIQKTGRKAEVLLSSSSSRRDELQSPRLPRGFRCIIPRCGYTSSKRNAPVAFTSTM
ncbi:hypothetical protein JRO89_XS04G0261800 [Xanthoceras sorbifolium]|uniref:HMA domain-containing protein n=1 Tax=Xanthoceras sorbifolium TaxID=99658 RepID=A0ABQ8I764_9ROSI|nr:hypothetical protein JRO89_XS04G0261800 [Xanthoceras sorbifolium]